MKKINLLASVNAFLLLGMIMISSCTKEGPIGLTGAPGVNGTNGKDANETCKLCHNQSVVDQKALEFEFSKHSYGEAAFEEAGNTSCTPCHTQAAFQYVCKNNTPVAYVFSATTQKWTNPYSVPADQALGEISCFTCHSSLHTTYGIADLSPLTTTAPVAMTMWSGTKTINITPGNGASNLCIKCHQPRPFTNSTNTAILNYDSLVSFPTAMMYDPTAASSANRIKPGYRTHTHYGTVGAIYAGKGGVEFTPAGYMGYSQMVHNTKASCQDCHMAKITGRAGGHTFVAKGNFNGCNTTACHGTGTVTATNAKYWVTPRAAIKSLLDQLAAKLKVGGVEILNRNPDAEANLWSTITTNKYDGYLNIYDPINNPNGIANNPTGTFQATGSTSSFSTEQKAINAALPKISLTNAQMGAIINFQLCLREYSLGIHNLDYSKALLTNSLAVLP